MSKDLRITKEEAEELLNGLLCADNESLEKNGSVSDKLIRQLDDMIKEW